MQALISKLRGMWTYALAASAAPLAYLVSVPCGAACGGCPMGGACFLSFPAVMAIVLVVKFSKKIQGAFDRPRS